MQRTKSPTTDGVLPAWSRSDCPVDMDVAAAGYERRFGIRFDTLTLFSRDDLAELHANDSGAELGPSLRRVDPGDSVVAAAMAVLGEVANGNRDRAARQAYVDALLDLYRALPTDVRVATAREDTLCVGPQREGAQLAKRMGCLPAGRSSAPHAKRIPYVGGLLVGLSGIGRERRFARCAVIDGAIATGATLIALAESLRPWVDSIEVFAAHGTGAGLSALVRYARKAGLDLTLNVAAIGGVLNEKYYAVDPTDVSKLLVGDLGDTIGDLLPRVEAGIR